MIIRVKGISGVQLGFRALDLEFRVQSVYGVKVLGFGA